MQCPYCKFGQKSTSPLALVNGKVVCQKCGKVILDQNIDFEITDENQEYYALGYSIYTESLLDNDVDENAKHIYQSYKLISQSALLKNPKACYMMAYLLVNDYLDDVVSNELVRVRMADDYLKAIISSEKVLPDVNTRALQTKAEELHQQIIRTKDHYLVFNYDENYLGHYKSVLSHISEHAPSPMFIVFKMKKEEAYELFTNDRISAVLKENDVNVQVCDDNGMVDPIYQAGDEIEDIRGRLDMAISDGEALRPYFIRNTKSSFDFMTAEQAENELDYIQNNISRLGDHFSAETSSKERIVTECDLAYKRIIKNDIIDYIEE